MGILDEIMRAQSLHSYGPIGLRPGAENPLGLANMGIRHDGSGPKGKGFLGLLPTPDGNVATEYSMGVDINGKPMEIPSIVPTLNPQELKGILGGEISASAEQKALAHALMRLKSGLSPFAGNNELRQSPGMVNSFGVGAPTPFVMPPKAIGSRG